MHLAITGYLLATLGLFALDEESPDHGYSLHDQWTWDWIRLLDRDGRPDPDGAVQQRFAARQYSTYALDLQVADFPMVRERAWTNSRRGLRLWVQSLNEFELANVVQIKERVDTGAHTFIAARYDRRQSRTADHGLFRIDFGLRDLGELPLEIGLRLHARWEKLDSDVELFATYAIDDLVTIGLTVLALDPFTNASFGLVEARGTVLDEHRQQEDLPLGFALEAHSASISGMRAEIYAGAVGEHQTVYRYPDAPERNHRRGLDAWSLGGLWEWRSSWLPAALGVSHMSFSTTTNWAFDQTPENDLRIEERTHRTRLYGLYTPGPSLHMEAFLQHIARPEGRLEGPAQTEQTRQDTEWLTSLTAMWVPLTNVGAELGFFRLQREATGLFEVNVDGLNHRFTTRIVLLARESLWIRFGVGWNLDGPGNVYDGGGFTLFALY